MIITRIIVGKKNNERYNIFVEDGSGERFLLSVDEAVLIKHHLHKGLTIDDHLFAKILDEDTIQKAYNLALRYLSFRMRTKKEMEDYLLKKEINISVIQKVIQKLLDDNLLNDEQFANFYVTSRINTTTKGPNLVKNELIEKGISIQIADNAVQAYSLEIQYEKAMKIANKRINRASSHSFKKQLQQLQAHLIRNGFSQSVIDTILEEISEEKDESEEWKSLMKQGEKAIKRTLKDHSDMYIARQKIKERLYRQGFSIEQINKFVDEFVKEHES